MQRAVQSKAVRNVVAGSDINQRIAQQVRLLRERQALSLEALSERSGVSRSMLSLIERGESSPTAVVLEKIATGLGVSLATLFDSPAAPASPVSHGRDRETWRDPASGYLRRNISPPNFPSPIQIIEVELPARARVAYESSPQGSGIHRQIWVKEGRVEVTVGGLTHRLKPDDCLASPQDEPTTYENRTRERALYWVVLAQTRPGGPHA